jgi:hypothetical protein
VSENACANCGNPLKPDSAFCPKCGAPTTAESKPVSPPVRLPRDRSFLPRLAAVAISVAVVALLVAVYLLAVYLPDQREVTTEGGAWVINGASPALGVTIGCSNCGQTPGQGTEFTVNINIQVSNPTCGYLNCAGYRVESFSVNSPYTVAQVSPENLPYSEAGGSFNTWSLTVTAPPSGGHYPLGGVVGVTYY